METASAAGFMLGCRSDKTERRSQPYNYQFIDNDYKQPDFEAHLEQVARFKPKYATVPDLSENEISENDVARAVRQYYRLTNYAETVFIVPKLPGQIAMLPADIPIAYSVPTSYGGAKFLFWELAGRRVHLLGGSPHEQLRLFHYIAPIATVVSVDGNMMQKQAIRFCKYWRRAGRNGGQWQAWPDKGKDQYFLAFEQSCHNIYNAWSQVLCLPTC